MSERATKRLKVEYAEALANPCPGITIKMSKDNLYVWEATVLGPSETPYEGGVFHMKIEFTAEYPVVAPKVKCLTKVFHANFNSVGDICLNILGKDWNPIYTVHKLLLAIQNLLTEPVGDDPLMPSVGNLLITNPAEYNRRARLYTRKYALPPK